jgi:2,4-dienoyl-CoA reductase-like NADH-dependent reductase (Old Yellow Enzyme family)
MFSAFRGEGSGIASIDQLIEMMARDEFDLVAVGRALLVDPAWAAKVRDGRMDQLMPYRGDALKVLA